MKKRILAVFLTVMMLLGTLPVAVGAANLSSGSLSMPKLSKTEIKQLVKDNSQELSDDIFDVTPSTSAPYTIGKVQSGALKTATNHLNFVRRLAGLPSVTLDTSLCENAQHGAVILAALGGLSHTPARPDGMDDSFYQQAYAATSSSNLYAGVSLAYAPFGFMDDSDSFNIDRVGHRRWQLNPKLGKVGFGYAVSNSSIYGRFVDEKVFDNSGTGCDYNFISWPSSGNFPSDLRGFSTYTAWSITLNPEKYQTQYQQLDNVVVTLTRQSDNKCWTFSNATKNTSDNASFFNVDYGGYGVSNCIIFRPNMDVEHFEGVYTVQVSGIKDKNGRNADFSYQVDFFTAGAANAGNTDLTWSLEDGVWYYYRYGSPVTGWQYIDGSWYFFDSLGEMITGWMKNDGTWYYLNSSGAMQTGWVNDGGTWYYMSGGGAMQTGWVNDGGWYYLGSSGAMATGWANDGGNWFYMNGSGVMQTGWVNDGGTWYYLQSSGVMTTGWMHSDNAWYYLSESGAMATGWTNDGGNWFYMDGSGVMQTGWLQNNGVWYYLNSNGTMATGTQTIDGTTYSFDSNGAWIA